MSLFLISSILYILSFCFIILCGSQSNENYKTGIFHRFGLITKTVKIVVNTNKKNGRGILIEN